MFGGAESPRSLVVGVNENDIRTLGRNERRRDEGDEKKTYGGQSVTIHGCSFSVEIWQSGWSLTSHFRTGTPVAHESMLGISTRATRNTIISGFLKEQPSVGERMLTAP